MADVAGYLRVSTGDQAQSGLGIEAQRQAIEAYCHMRSLGLAHVYQDNGISASKALGDRPAGKRLLAALRARRRPLDGVVALKLDRLFRNTVDALETIQQWDRTGQALHLVDMGGASLDTRSATGKLFLTVIAAMGEMERNLARERTKAAMAVKRSRGERISRHAPYGYRFNRAGLLVVDPAEQATLRQMRTLRESGLSFQRIAEALEGQGIRNRLGRPWTWKRVRAVLEVSAKQG